MRMELKRVTAPTEAEILDLVRLSEVKANKRVRHTLEDELFRGYIQDAFEFFDGPTGWLRRALLPQTWVGYVDNLSLSNQIEIPLAPLRTIDTVEYVDDAGAWTTLAADQYQVVGRGTFNTLEPAFNVYWPSVSRRQMGVRITFAAGYDAPGGANPTPRPILRAIKLLVGSLYEHREADVMDNRVTEVSRKIEYGIEKFAGPYRIPLDMVD